MFDFVRRHTKAMQLMLFLLIVPSFALFGIDGYNRFRENSATVAEVDGQSITQPEWDAAHKSEVDRIRASMPTLDAKLLDSPEAKYATLERLVRERVLSVAAEKSRLATSDQRLARDLQNNPAIAELRRPDGSLDMERYRQLLGSQGMTPEMFEARVRADLSVQQVVQGVTSTGLVSNAVADMALQAYFEKREIQLGRFNTTDFQAKVVLSDADLEAYYKANPGLFQAPEQASIEYLVLDPESLRKNLSVSEADLKTYYEQNTQRLGGQEERRASHILITAPKTASAEERQKARARADELLAQVTKAPDSFAELAKKNSQDPGSAAKGGDLDFFARGAMVKPFEETVFRMKKGETSGVVESDFGFHIIRLTDIKAPKQRSYEEMKPELEAELKKQQAQRKFAESADAFSNGVYEQADSLKPVAERLKLEIRTASNITRQPAAGVTGVLANPKFLNAIFAPDAVDKKRNTEAIETAANQLVSGRVTQYAPARTLPLAEVKDKVRERVLAARAAELARTEGLAKLAEWKRHPEGASLAEPVVVSRETGQKLSPSIIEAALRADLATLPAWVGVDLGPQGYAVVKVNKLLPRDTAAEPNAKQDRQQYVQWWSAAENLAYYKLLQERYKARIKVAKPVALKAEDGAAQQ